MNWAWAIVTFGYLQDRSTHFAFVLWLRGYLASPRLVTLAAFFAALVERCPLCQLAIDWARLRVTSANLVKVATVFKILSVFATSTQDASLPLLCASTTWSVTLAEGSPVTKFTFDITRLSVAEASLGWWQTQTATQLRQLNNFMRPGLVPSITSCGAR